MYTTVKILKEYKNNKYLYSVQYAPFKGATPGKERFMIGDMEQVKLSCYGHLGIEEGEILWNC